MPTVLPSSNFHETNLDVNVPSRELQGRRSRPQVAE